MHFFSVLTNAPIKRVDFSAVGVDTLFSFPLADKGGVVALPLWALHPDTVPASSQR